MFNENQSKAINALISGVHIGQSKGSYSLEESAHLHSAITFLREESEAYHKSLESQKQEQIAVEEKRSIEPEEIGNGHVPEAGTAEFQEAHSGHGYDPEWRSR